MSVSPAGSSHSTGTNCSDVVRARMLRSRESRESAANVSSSVSNKSELTASALEEIITESEQNKVNTASHYLDHHRGSQRRDTMITTKSTPKKPRKDNFLQEVYCWECHKESVLNALDCHSCVRSYHDTCLPPNAERPTSSYNTSNWSCPVCMAVANSDDNKSAAMQNVTREELNILLSYALQRMRHKDSEPFQTAVPKALVPDYEEYVFNPFDMLKLEERCASEHYRCVEQFVQDAQWIYHNSWVFNGPKNKYTNDAKLIMKICRNETSEIELCPDCYRLSNERPPEWFTIPCHSPSPHCLVWAKMKGYPWWPGKVLKVANNQVDVRFFGEYDRARVPLKDVQLISEEQPQSTKLMKKQGLDIAISELRQHVNKLRLDIGDFSYAPINTAFKAEYMTSCPLFDKSTVYDTSANTANNSIIRKSLDRASSSPARSVMSSSEKSASVAKDTPIEDEPVNQKNVNEVEQPETDGESNASGVFAMNEEDADGLLIVSEKSTGKEDSVVSDSDKTKSLDKSEDNLFTHLEHVLGTKQEEVKTSVEEEEESPVVVPVEKEPTMSVLVDTVPNSATNHNAEVPPTGQSAQSMDVDTGNVNAGRKRPMSHLEQVLTKPLLTQPAQKIHQLQSDTPGSVPVPVPATAMHTYKQTILKHKQKMQTMMEDSFSELERELSSCASQPSTSAAVPHTPQVPSTSSAAGSSSQSASSEPQSASMRFVAETIATELKRSTAASVNEMRRVLELEIQAKLLQQRQQQEKDMKDIIKNCKAKQWCALCGKEAVFYCCWNTSYCDYPCQQRHWPSHQATCAQVNSTVGNGNGAGNNSNSSANSNMNTVTNTPIGGVPPNVVMNTQDAIRLHQAQQQQRAVPHPQQQQRSRHGSPLQQLMSSTARHNMPGPIMNGQHNMSIHHSMRR